MEDEEAARNQMTETTSPPGSCTSTGSGSGSGANMSFKKDGSAFVGLLYGRRKYKVWALAAIALLALWSMFTGSTVTLKWSAVNLTPESAPSINGDPDVLDIDERNKMVKQMWNVYKHSKSARLPSFWRDAFGAAYQDLTSGESTVHDAALLEIAKMSFRSRELYDSPPIQSTRKRRK